MDSQSLLPITDEPTVSSMIKVVGIGGGGSNAVNYMYNKGIKGVDFIVCNTDIQALKDSPVSCKIQIGKELTNGLGAGSIPKKGKESALESIDYIESIITDKAKMIFITAGMGGGTGTGAAPVIAKRARENGILTVGIVTIPFYFEGKKRLERALVGIEELNKYVDSILVINNQKLREMYGNLKLSEAFNKADDVLSVAAKSLAEIITVRGFINVDFKDVESVTKDSGVAVMGAGEQEGDNRSINALKEALTSPLLNSSDIRGASSILLNIVSGENDPTMDEVDEVTAYLKELVGGDVDIIWGLGNDKSLGKKIRISIIATGFNRSPLPNTEEIDENGMNSSEIILEVENPDFLEQEAKKKREASANRKRERNIIEDDRLNNEEINVDTWFRRRFSQIFADKDTKM